MVRVAAFRSLLLWKVSGQLPGNTPCDLSPSPVEAPQAPAWLSAIVTNRPGLSDCHGAPGLATSHGDVLVSIKELFYNKNEIEFSSSYSSAVMCWRLIFHRSRVGHERKDDEQFIMLPQPEMMHLTLCFVVCFCFCNCYSDSCTIPLCGSTTVLNYASAITMHCAFKFFGYS